MGPTPGLTVPITGEVYISMACHGHCKRCGCFNDLRMGACFRCSDRVRGKLIAPGLHKLWDVDAPHNIWVCLDSPGGQPCQMKIM